jgi:hypothetical protein
MTNFASFPKMARLSRPCVITEKIDGTNAQILILHESEVMPEDSSKPFISLGEARILAGSRSKWISTSDDNFGFARWVEENKETIVQLGYGRHYGEWWGAGIQRRYGMKEKVFSLFNTGRWTMYQEDAGKTVAPACCSVVPIIYEGMFDSIEVENALNTLRTYGSIAAPGFMNPEGVVVYHVAGNVAFKKTLEKDSEPKGKSNGR